MTEAQRPRATCLKGPEFQGQSHQEPVPWAVSCPHTTWHPSAMVGTFLDHIRAAALTFHFLHLYSFHYNDQLTDRPWLLLPLCFLNMLWQSLLWVLPLRQAAAREMVITAVCCQTPQAVGLAASSEMLSALLLFALVSPLHPMEPFRHQQLP